LVAIVKRLWACISLALIPGQGTSQLLRQLADVFGQRSNDRRRVLAGDLDQHGEAGMALDQGGDVGVVRSGKKVCPGTARSSISAGRSRIETISRICPCPLLALWLLGRRIRRAVRFFSTPRVWMNRLR
jgi:hypothetical protein